eukprot:scaffold5.g863.t1
MGAALSAPVINDVTTDPTNPPAFTAAAARHPSTLPPHVSVAIAKHYSHLRPLCVPGRSVGDVLVAARGAAGAALPRAVVTRVDAAAGELELVDITLLLRVREEGGAAVVDVRSASRLGKGDLGANAARISRLLEALKRQLELRTAAAQEHSARTTRHVCAQAQQPAEHGDAMLSLTQGAYDPTLDALPYYDTLSAEEKKAVNALIEEELRHSTKTPADYLAELPPLPASRLQDNAILQAELQRVEAEQPMEGLDTQRYNLDPPPPAKRNDVGAWKAALANAHSQLEHQYSRLLNLELLLKFGPGAWRSQLADVRQQIDALNRERKLQQTAAGREIAALEAEHLALVLKNQEIAAAVAGLRASVAALAVQAAAAGGGGPGAANGAAGEGEGEDEGEETSDSELDAEELELSSSEEAEEDGEYSSGGDDYAGGGGGSSGEEDEGAEPDEQEIERAVLGYIEALEEQRREGGVGGSQAGAPCDSEGSEEGSEGAPAGSSEDEWQQQQQQPQRRMRGQPRAPLSAAAAAEAAGADGPAPSDGEEDEAGGGGAAGAAGGADPGSDSSEDERPARNTVGDVPLEWYSAEEHVGYDLDGNKLARRGRRDRLDAMLARADSAKAWRTVYDEYNDEEIVLSKDEMHMIQRIRAGRFPHVDPFEPEADWFTRDVEAMPLSAAPEPKRRFVPSKWEEKKRDGPGGEGKWGGPALPARSCASRTADKTATGLTYIPAPKLRPPGHAESYNPPREYLPSEADKAAAMAAAEEEGAPPPFVPTGYDSLRKVPAYATFVQERFERCLDLYLCPRVRRKRLEIKDPESLVPQLPQPRDLQPFPTQRALLYEGHEGAVRCLAPDPTGQWLLTGGEDGSMRLWEVATGRCMRAWQLGGGGGGGGGSAPEPVASVAWCPDPRLRLASAAVGRRLVLLPAPVGGEAAAAATEAALAAALAGDGGAGGAGVGDAPGEGALAVWRRRGPAPSAPPPSAPSASASAAPAGGPSEGIEVVLRFPTRQLAWHARGDYFASVAPDGNTQAVLVHQLSRGASQNPFRKNRGRVARVLFHPSKPFFFVATQQHHVFHGMVYSDLMTNPLIVPVKILRGHEARAAGGVGRECQDAAFLMGVVDFRGVLDLAFHPTQPWLFTAGADGTATLWRELEALADQITAEAEAELQEQQAAAGGEPSPQEQQAPLVSQCWEAAFDYNSNRYYYASPLWPLRTSLTAGCHFNRATGQSQWHLPDDWVPDGRAAGASTAAAAAALPPEAAPDAGAALPASATASAPGPGPGYWYRDAWGLEQGPYSAEQLAGWRGHLPMDLPLWAAAGPGRPTAAERAAPVPLAQLTGDGELLARWREENPDRAHHVCAAPPPARFEADSTRDSATSLAEAVLAGLPATDEAVQVIEWNHRQSDYAATALHCQGRGRIQATDGKPESLYAEYGNWVNPEELERQLSAAAAARKRPLTREELRAAKARKAEWKGRKMRAWLST